MTRSSLLLMSITLAVFGISTMLGHPPWGAVTGIAFILTAAAMGAGALTSRARSDSNAAERAVSSQRVSNSLAALSATAILAVYTAGYYRTREAAEKLEAQSRRQPLPIIVAAVQPQNPAPSVVIPPKPAAQTSQPQKTAKSSAKNSAAGAKNEAEPPPPAPSQILTVQTGAKTAPVSDAVPESATKTAANGPELTYKDGSYSAWGTCRHGDLEATVVIDQGKIASAKITQCLTRYPCSWIAQLPGQVVSRQSADVDYVAGATQSTDAYYQAVAAALAKALE